MWDSDLCEQPVSQWQEGAECLCGFRSLSENQLSWAQATSTPGALLCWSPACIPSEGAHTVRCSRETSLCYVWSWQCFPSSYKNKNCTGENPHFSSQKKKKTWKEFKNDKAHSSLCVKVCLTSVHCVMFSLLRGHSQPWNRFHMSYKRVDLFQNENKFYSSTILSV